MKNVVKKSKKKSNRFEKNLRLENFGFQEFGIIN